MSVPRRTLATLRKQLALIDGALRALEKLDGERLTSSNKPVRKKVVRLSLIS